VTAAWWDALEPPWRRCLEQAWEAFCNGSVPVGAVITGPDGSIVAAGRNRQREETAPSPQIAGTNLAHAEVNALIQLPRGWYLAHTLYSTLQPCLLCTGAICHTHIGTVRYAARDPIFSGIDRLPELNAHVARRWPRWEVGHESRVSSWSQLLTFVFAIRDDPAVLTSIANRSADLYDRATAMNDLAAALDALTDRPLEDVLVDDGVAALRELHASLVSHWWPNAADATD
jgi:tRNA(Arg) A34 adenosine deaminase TadA